MDSDPLAEDAFDDRTREIVVEARETRDTVALRELYSRVAPCVYGWAKLRVRVGFQGRIDPDDIVQETWLRALRKIDDYDPTWPFRAWILKIARYVLIEASRALPRGAGGQRTCRTTFFRSQPDESSGVSTIAGRNDALEHFLERAAALSQLNRELVVLRGIEGRSFEEIAKQLGESADTLTKRWRRLREKMVQGSPPDFLL